VIDSLGVDTLGFELWVRPKFKSCGPACGVKVKHPCIRGFATVLVMGGARLLWGRYYSCLVFKFLVKMQQQSAM